MSEHAYLKWFSTTPSIYWHDSAVRAQQVEAFGNGATGMTTNPFLIQSTLNSDRAFWADRLAKLPRGLKGDEKAMELIHLVTGYYLEEAKPIFEKGNPGEGYICAQTNPLKCGDADYMIEQVKTMGKTPVLLSLPPIDSARYLRHISRGLSEENILKWMQNDRQYITNWHERYNIEVFNTAIENNIPKYS